MTESQNPNNQNQGWSGSRLAEDQKQFEDRLHSAERKAFRRTGLSVGLLVAVGLAFFVYTLVQAQKARVEASELEQKIQQLKAERDGLEHDLQKLRTQRDDLKESVQELTAGITALPQGGPEVQQLKSEALQVRWKYPPKQAWCYQERTPGKPAQKQFAVHCHWSQERCEKAKTGSKTATACALVPNLDAADWSPQPHGFMDSWFQLDRSQPLPPPSPQFSNADTGN